MKKKHLTNREQTNLIVITKIIIMIMKPDRTRMCSSGRTIGEFLQGKGRGWDKASEEFAEETHDRRNKNGRKRKKEKPSLVMVLK